MKTIKLEQGLAYRHQFTLDCAKQGKLRAGSAFHGFKYSDRALLVDPINGAPTVYVSPSTLVVFDSKPGDGTDHLRQRILAEAFFGQINEQAAGAA
jgi:hypothetical protein